METQERTADIIDFGALMDDCDSYSELEACLLARDDREGLRGLCSVREEERMTGRTAATQIDMVAVTVRAIQQVDPKVAGILAHRIICEARDILDAVEWAEGLGQ